MNIEYTKPALKQIAGFDKAMQKRVKASVEKLPDGDVKKLRGLTNSYRLRIGSYRIIYTISDGSIIINAALPRGEAYKNL
jgi:mRNA interferase RelE/StbE